MDKHVGQWDRTENPEMNSYICDHLGFEKSARTGQWGKDNPSVKGAETIGYLNI